MSRATFRLLASLFVAAITVLAAGIVATPGAADIRPRPTVIPQPTPSQRPPIVVMSVGDSLSVGHGPNGTFTESYRPELSKLMGMSGQPHTWVVQALGGTTCGYWAARMGQLLDTYHPRIVFLNCGTNDGPADPTEADYRTILAAAQSRGVQVIASLIGIPDMRTDTNRVRPFILNQMHNTNLAIKRALAGFPSVPVADVQRVPATLEWLQVDGIHWTWRMETAVGQLFYQAAQPVMGWRTLEQMHTWEMCGLSGSWVEDPEPVPDVDYRMCLS